MRYSLSGIVQVIHVAALLPVAENKKALRNGRAFKSLRA
jgi:hypothetical protein